MILNIFNLNVLFLRKIAIITVILFWIKLFYWMRLFENTAGFIRMLQEIVKDCKPFMIMLFICIGMFANGFLLLDFSRKLAGNDVISAEAFG